jgi:3',5'-cyclic AMP phosphodiesterase CpdA
MLVAQDYLRRDVLELCGGMATALAFSPLSIAAGSRDSHKAMFRFAIASDLHFGQKGSPYDKNINLLISKLNEEKGAQGLDAVFFNGDLVHNSTTAYEDLKRNYLQKLNTPYYAIKGNHDYVDGQKESPGESWEKIWGYPSNHVVRIKKMTFILADTTAPRQGSEYLPADIDWLKKQLSSLKNDDVVFVLMHIAQCKKDIEGWPKAVVGHKNQPGAETGEAVMTLLESHKNVRAVFHGHNHNEVGRYISGKKPYFFDSHIGGSFGNKIGYRIVEVNSDKSITTYQYNMQDSVIMNQHSL